MSKLNNYNGNADFNTSKPWSINQYGILEGRRPFGPFSVRAPDDFPQYNNDKYQYMWAKWIPAGANGHWLYPEWNACGIEPLHDFVLRCIST